MRNAGYQIRLRLIDRVRRGLSTSSPMSDPHKHHRVNTVRTRRFLVQERFVSLKVSDLAVVRCHIVSSGYPHNGLLVFSGSVLPAHRASFAARIPQRKTAGLVRRNVYICGEKTEQTCQTKYNADTQHAWQRR